MADTTVKIDTETRDRLAAIAAARGTSVRALVAELALQEENQLKLGQATTAFIGEQFVDDPSVSLQMATPAELALAAALLYHATANATAHQGGQAGWRSAGSAMSSYSPPSNIEPRRFGAEMRM